MKSIFIMLSIWGSMISLVSFGQTLSRKIMANADALVYQYNNGTVAPECQATVRIIVSADSVVRKITTRKGVTRVSYPLSNGRYETFKSEILSCGIKALKKAKESKCCGGTNHFFGVYDIKDECIFSAQAYKCGGKLSGTMTFRIDPMPYFSQVLAESKKAPNDTK